MRILAVDTTGAHSSVALLEGEQLRGEVDVMTERPQHVEGLLPTVDYLLERLGIALPDVDGFAVSCGPGSFTGLRIGIATVEGLAYSLDRPAVGVSSLDATAHRYRHRAGRIVAWIQAYRGEVYAREYDSNGIEVEPAGEASCEPPARLLDRLTSPPAMIVGSGTAAYGALVREKFGDAVGLGEASFFLGEPVARLGARRIAAGERAPLGGLSAFYVRASEAERQRLSKSRAQ